MSGSAWPTIDKSQMCKELQKFAASVNRQLRHSLRDSPYLAIDFGRVSLLNRMLDLQSLINLTLFIIKKLLQFILLPPSPHSTFRAIETVLGHAKIQIYAIHYLSAYSQLWASFLSHKDSLANSMFLNFFFSSSSFPRNSAADICPTCKNFDKEK